MPRPRIPTIAQYVQQVRQTLGRTAAELDTSIGTVSRKMIDAFGEASAEVGVDSYIQSYDYDLSAKEGADLDEYVARFGFARKPPRRATGTVTFIRTDTDSRRFIRQGTEVLAVVNDRVYPFVTTEPVVLSVGITQIDAGIIAGVVGEGGNVPAGSITRFASGNFGVAEVSNSAATTGGTPPESDQSLRNRFRSTLFRNLAGTIPNLSGIALDNLTVRRVNAIGAKLVHVEQIEISSGTGTSGLTSDQYIFPSTVVLADDLDEGPFYAETTNFTFDPSTKTVTAVSGVPDGLYLLSFEYIPQSSRNSPGGPLNRVDIWVDGVDSQQAVETLVFSTGSVFTAGVNTRLYTDRFERNDGSNPVAGNFFVPYALRPVIDPSDGDSLTIDAVTLTEDTDFWVVNDVTAYGGAPQSLSGIEIDSTAASGISNLSVFSATYTYNDVPRQVADEIATWRFPHNDVWVHQADDARLRLYFVVIPTPGFTKSFIEDELFRLLGSRINDLTFGSIIQTSDLLGFASPVSSLDAIRFATSDDDGTNYAIQKVADDGTLLETYDDGGSPARAIDVLLTQRELAVLDQVTVILRAQNTYGVGA